MTTNHHHWRDAGGGSVTPSKRHYKTAGPALRQQWADGSRLVRTHAGLVPAEHARSGMQAWVYCESALEGALEFTFAAGPDAGDHDEHGPTRRTQRHEPRRLAQHLTRTED